MNNIRLLATILLGCLWCVITGCHNSNDAVKLRAELMNANEDKKCEALLEISKTGPPSKNIFSEVVKCLDDPSWKVRSQAVFTLGAIGPADKVIPEIIRMLDDNNDAVRLSAATVLWANSDESNEAIPKLRQLAAYDKSKQVRSAAKRALEKIEVG